MSLLDCRHQDRAIARLQRARRAGRIPHSYIFHGPEGVGKGLLARQWAQTMLCASPTQHDWPAAPPGMDNTLTDACGQCHECHLVGIAGHPDLHIVNRQTGGKVFAGDGTPKTSSRQMIDLPIDVIREFVIDCAGLRPSHDRARIFIIEEAETMNRAAQNALLKTLEEPPESTFIVLVTSEPARFLPTIRSRCQMIRFEMLPAAFVVERLCAQGVAPEQAAYWADFSQGRLGPSLQMAQMNMYDAKCQLVNRLAGLDHLTLLDTAKWLVDQAKEFGEAYVKSHEQVSPGQANRRGQDGLLQMAGHAFSLALRHGATGAEPVDQPQQVADLAARLAPEGAAAAVRATERARQTLHSNVNATLLFEALLLDYLDCAQYHTLVQ